MTGVTGPGGPQKWLKDIKGLLITGLVVFVCLQLLVAALIPLVPYLLAGLVLVAIIALAFNRGSKL